MSDLDKLWVMFHRYEPMLAEQYAAWLAQQTPPAEPASEEAEPAPDEEPGGEEPGTGHLTRPTGDPRTTTRHTTTTTTRT
jgi:hypothetical protein